jgi:hypothetical protein
MIIRIKLIGLIALMLLNLSVMGCVDTSPNLVLFDFETDSELDRIHWQCHTLMSISDHHTTHGSKSLKLELHPSPYPGFKPVLKQRNWEKFNALQFDIYNPANEDAPITIRIDDKKDSNEYADRYNKTFLIQPGLSQMIIPLDSLVTSGTNRQLNLERIDKFLLFSVNPTEKMVLYLDYIRLVR